MVAANNKGREFTLYANSVDKDYPSIVDSYKLVCSTKYDRKKHEQIVIPRSLETITYQTDKTKDSILTIHRENNYGGFDYKTEPFYKQETKKEYRQRIAEWNTAGKKKSIRSIRGVVPVREILQAQFLEDELFTGIKTDYERSWEAHSEFDGSVILHEEFLYYYPTATTSSMR